MRAHSIVFCLVLFLCVSLYPPATAASDLDVASTNDQVDPTEYFTGSQYRPKLEIIRPENGQVLSDGILDIEILISGYELPSHFDESSTCIALSKDKGLVVVDHCFDQSPELIFHVNGLTPGEGYTLRVLFLERGKVIALSVRSFRVGGVVGVLAEDESRPVSIQTALQVALQLQVEGLHWRAEQIYQRVLSESPSNADALNNLGVHFHQRGEGGREGASADYMSVSLSIFLSVCLSIRLSQPSLIVHYELLYRNASFLPCCRGAQVTT
jgi:hypothetical protein